MMSDKVSLVVKSVVAGGSGASVGPLVAAACTAFGASPDVAGAVAALASAVLSVVLLFARSPKRA